MTAYPRPREEAAALDPQPEVVDAARARGVEEIVHFTTLPGAVGILGAQAVMTRSTLPEQKYLEYVYRPNAVNPQRNLDRAWHDYVNLSISRINDWMFAFSAREHAHEKASWLIFSFSPEVLGDPGVVFTTTNNIYPACRREEGLPGFEAMFDDPVVGRYATEHHRAGLPDHWTTDRQAEVLYPGDLSLGRLQRIYVEHEVALDDINGALGALDGSWPVVLAPERFK